MTMDRKDSRKSQRTAGHPYSPPPSPPVQRPNTPVPTSSGINTGIPPSQFYGKRPPKTTADSPPKADHSRSNSILKASPPPLPSRPSGTGSSHTTFGTIDTKEQPPVYSDETFRGPELVSETNIEDEIPPLCPAEPTEWSWPSNNASIGDWGNVAESSWSTNTQGNWASSTWMPETLKANVPIERSANEEAEWWKDHGRPGPGYLPSMVEAELHDADHTLFSVIAQQPKVPSSTPAGSSTAQPSTAASTPAAASSSSPPSSQETHPSPPHVPPSDEEIRKAVPHPNVYYCPKDNNWTLIQCLSSAVLPKLTAAAEKQYRLPAQHHRARLDCLKSGKDNKTHHFHKYPQAVDSARIQPPYRDIHQAAAVREKHRRTAIIDADIDVEKMQIEEVNNAAEEAGFLLDLYVCCTCACYCIVSPPIDGIVKGSVWAGFVADRRENPQVGRSKEVSLYKSVAALAGILLALLWNGQRRNLKKSGKFLTLFGTSSHVTSLFESWGYITEIKEGEQQLAPPAVDLSPNGRIGRAKALRAWIEINAWLQDYKRINASLLEDTSTETLPVSLTAARSMYQEALGSDPEHMPRDNAPGTLDAYELCSPAVWVSLGLTPTTATPEFLEFAYYAQCRCDPKNTVQYFSDVSDVVMALSSAGLCTSTLEEFIITEQSRGRFTLTEIVSAAKDLGFPDLYGEYDTSHDDAFIENAWKHAVQEAWKNNDSAAERKARTALRMIALHRGTPYLLDVLDKANSMMTPEQAYQALEVASEVDDATLIMVYQMRLDEQPMQLTKWASALTAIAEVRNSERLKTLANKGYDPGEISAATRPEWPRGLNQLGNTCYLNSLLQYFYTIKDLRDAVLGGVKAIDDNDSEKLSDDDLKRHRVGGRLVTRREILRSKKFLGQLGGLFYNLEYETSTAVTPTLDLAKLALITSKDEEEDEVDQGGSDASNDTEATLVDDGPIRLPHVSTEVAAPPKSPSPPRSPGSVLGKRARDLARESSAMDVDTPPATASGSGTKQDEDVEMADGSQPQATMKPPPLPARKKSLGLSDSGMMFGKQHDVAECMDNCMFQIETALLKFGGKENETLSESDKTSVVKRLFYGKMRQNVLAKDENLEKEDLFSHLPVNVSQEGYDLYDGLSQYFYDVVDYKDQKVPMQLSIVSLPPLLHVQLQRVQFDRERLQSWKSQAYVKFSDTLYMDRFMEDAPAEKKSQTRILEDELYSCRERLSTIQNGKNGSFDNAIANTSAFFRDSESSKVFVGIDEEFLTVSNAEAASIKAQVVELQQRISSLKQQLEQVWQDEQKVVYELTSVFIHRGATPTFGHYFFYSRHLPDKPDEWFKYNDAEVSPISKEDVFADTTGQTANPYLLVYVRKGSNVVDAVKRTVG
ncbi:cysteine proteinase [Cylindrobasidium torrendii FP15055 ss-10]|uniref:ubiquitinyl hydrolase 1 n=1 Tax=Cylindrobasidium torrendii FP15055 ss-10 TaxID=1314674 RepID=A0A0D7BSK9_9AGAR|nr:cysteine proteinase [Cylindrobasidium torrendii FP15055 ss-10]